VHDENDDRVISVPLARSWRLSEAAPAQRANWELIGDGRGVHWPDVVEDISGGHARGRARTTSAEPHRGDNSWQRAAADEPRASQGHVQGAIWRGSRLSADVSACGADGGCSDQSCLVA
jgi:uncharacterized protein DUF2442